MRKPFVAGNWKMNTDSLTSVSLAQAVAAGAADVAGDKIDVALLPPFVYICNVIGALSTSHIAVGAQDIYFEQKGAFTGEISPAMLKDVGCTYCLCGHSERRHVIKENDSLINKKVHATVSGGLLPILCVGELFNEHKSNKTSDVVTQQLEAGLADLSEEKASAVTIAYEPVWAIGTGLNATPQQAQEVHAMIRKLVAKIYNKNLADEIRILYGGSVKADNAAQIMIQPDVDGLLVGGASLKADEFVSIIKASIQ
jgi:triosephosphate isomerase (TIM)